MVAALVGTTLLGALAVFGGGGSSVVDVPAQGPWTVLVAGDLRTVSACAEDPMVVDAYVGADEPGNGGGLVLAADADVADVERVVRCVAQGIDPERITVVTSPLEDRGA
ncbi:hypothetical protein [Cellulomonas xiejunii]|uniref:Uncharacterized protein n=1 Tax=Cellulomonas xiejunii TaxID=2968083 RepID=A0ABY5KSB0_9CELL|nr:hypothetical protein [Cellulomonas xiejunii]MCC2321399.1 hypothetical protein [Cellulomonas xiejunii]UUI71980.1 hypothetical protein NP048_00445 [Cellulomonas xiejunii]